MYRNLIALPFVLKGGNVRVKPYSLFHASLQYNPRPEDFKHSYFGNEWNVKGRYLKLIAAVLKVKPA